jgi:uncharacterized membrane protein
MLRVRAETVNLAPRTTAERLLQLADRRIEVAAAIGAARVAEWRIPTMAVKLHELHPSLVHYPLALLPLSIGADVLGSATGNEQLLDLGKRTMPLVALSGLVAGVAGLMAQTEVKANGAAMDMLKTHRTLNLGLVTIAGAMAARRARTDKPSAAYLGLGLAGIAALMYSAYLGGEMVYHKGVGVEAADGVREQPAVPELSRRDARRALRTAATDTAKGIQVTVEETAKGDLVPSLVGRSEARVEGA